MKLRTLKDLKRNVDNLYFGYEVSSKKEKMALLEGYLRGFIDLKQEAIEWIKSYEKEIFKIIEEGNKEPLRKNHLAGAVGWIKIFFDITNKDLDSLKANKEIQ